MYILITMKVPKPSVEPGTQEAPNKECRLNGWAEEMCGHPTCVGEGKEKVKRNELIISTITL